MMRIISWNIQWGRGADGRVDLERTIAVIRALGEAEVICLQEVAQGFPSISGERDDGVGILSAAFPHHEAVFVAGVDVPGERGGRGRFGNLLLSSLPLLQIFRHALPFPADPRVPGMPRSCVEAVLEAPWGPMRVLTTHLEYYSVMQRRTQIAALRHLQEEAAGHAGRSPSGRDANPVFAVRPRPMDAVICGDFNMEPDSPEYALMGEPTADDGVNWVDAWRVAYAATPHAPSVGVHGADWPDRAYCCDFFWVSESLAPRVLAIDVDGETAASDHQPVLLELVDQAA